LAECEHTDSAFEYLNFGAAPAVLPTDSVTFLPALIAFMGRAAMLASSVANGAVFLFGIVSWDLIENLEFLTSG
jgi:hypothetical protein